MFSGILFTMTLRLMFIKTWKASNDTWLEKVTLFQGWSPKMCICSMDLGISPGACYWPSELFWQMPDHSVWLSGTLSGPLSPPLL